MQGPDIAWYLVVSAMLFSIGTAGVLLRRSPLIVLLSLEIMLNGANLALISFARLHGGHDGQIFALAVMAVAASEVVVGLGLIVAIARKRLDLDVDRLRVLRDDDHRRLALPARAARRRAPDRPAAAGRSRGGRPAGSRRSPSSPPSAARSRPSSPCSAATRRIASSCTTAWTWLSGGGFDVDLTLLVDPLSVTMMLIVSGVGGLIVLYSVGYMDGDPEERRYFAYMSLFVFAMLLLVQAGNFLILLAGWGLVGLASYLLIGFWHERPEAVAAAKKAFVMNAFGDATMALAFFVLIWQTGTLDFEGAFAGASGMSSTAVNLVALGLLGGAVAKSAQIPLHTWLPDAMEGPTPVSALIHAATMVTAGVYLIVRAHPIFELAPSIADLAAGLGALTLLVAGPDRARADGHQARDRVLDDVADRLHVPRRGDRRVRERDVPPADARVLQGAALPGGRSRDPPPRR